MMPKTPVTSVARFAVVTALMLFVVSPLLAQSPCRTIHDQASLEKNEWIVYASRGEHATFELDSDFDASTLLVEGTICGPGGKALGNVPVSLVSYRPVEPPAKGEVLNPTPNDLQVGRGAGFEITGERQVDTAEGGAFRAMVPTQALAVQVPWERLSQDVGVVVIDVRFAPGPSVAPAYRPMR